MDGHLLARRYGLPAWMYERATQRRLAGDWRGACDAARVDIAFDLSTVDGAVAGPLAEDLRHLVPDLLRWHFPRGRHGMPRTGAVRLATYGRRVDLVASRDFERPHRLVLRLQPHPGASWQFADWVELRHTWDLRHTDAYRRHVGGGDRVPFFRRDGTPLTAARLPGSCPDGSDPVRLAEWTALRQEAGETIEAWRDAGFDVSVARPPGTPDWHDFDAWSPTERWALVDDPRAMVTMLAERVARLPDGAELCVLAESRTVPYWLALGRRDGRASATLRQGVPPEAGRLAVAAWVRPLDLELLRDGRLAPENLHPLVRAAWFPEHRAAPDVYRPPVAPVPALPLTVRVPCGGTEHDVILADGAVVPVAHTATEIEREAAFAALGGPVAGCVAATTAWRRPHPESPDEPPTGPPDPEPVRELRRHALCAALHGDARELHRLLDAGLDLSIARTRTGVTPLHLIGGVEPVDVDALVRRLVAAGADVNAAAWGGATPLLTVVREGGRRDLVRLLLDLGADPTATERGENALHLVLRVGGPDDAVLTRMLIDGGVPLDAREPLGRTPADYARRPRPPAESARVVLEATESFRREGR
ncbi:hypothetical protein Val02_03630 [Virgisporangium aliadipatigenens]|uniref:Ankyrin repeat domain-containing protein n=1 Tax=Virgisporangium aliadipatigenens TaxID=741659 RepID=A0A8J3YFU6_9ACTN|nr:hypothetical protein [Virgisporangium aliadipatigenens]GIJ43477.1 hypothetical protein Val02_03630 [Virgisporangium aliadipatigenens]